MATKKKGGRPAKKQQTLIESLGSLQEGGEEAPKESKRKPRKPREPKKKQGTLDDSNCSQTSVFNNAPPSNVRQPSKK